MTGRQFLQRALKQRRKELGDWSQERLAAESGVNIGVVQRLEQGQNDTISDHHRLALARALRWEDDWLAKLRAGHEPEERAPETVRHIDLPHQLRSMMDLADELDEPMKQRALNAALKAFVTATASE